MKTNQIFVAVAVVVLLVVGIFAYNKNKSSQEAAMMKNEESTTDTKEMAKEEGVVTEEQEMQEKPDSMMEDDDAMKKDDTMMEKNDARYVPYSKAALDNAKDSRRVLYFYASWCPTCRPADADFATNAAKIPTDLTVIRVNYNDPETDAEEKALATKYGITYQHTFVQIDAAGQEVTTWNGGSLADLLSNIK